MDPDGESNKQVKRKRKETKHVERNIVGSMPIFQSIWVRCCSIFANQSYGGYLESQFRFVLYCGTFLWLLYFFS